MLTRSDCSFILTSLRYTEMKFENYLYPTYELKRQRLDECYAVIMKVRELRDALTEEQSDD